jgi:acetylornithine deacetylase/succinyl-diaminopimelate desuccinylase-like protein
MHADLTSALATIVSFKTVPGETKERMKLLDWVEREFLSRAGMKIERGVAAGVPYLYLHHPHSKLLWFAHVDVVPGNDAQFSIAINDDHVLGRGVKDMKGPALTFLLAYRDLCENGTVPPVSVLLTSDEETGGKSLVELQERGIFSGVPVAFTPDSGEHPGIVVELKGAVWARLICRGKGSHAGMPWLGSNPIPSLATVIHDLVAAYPSSKDDSWVMTVTPTQLFGSDAINKVPDEARATLDIRFPASVCVNPAEAMARISALLPSHCGLEPIVMADPLTTDPNHPMVQRIKRLAEAVTGTSVPLHRENGSSDARTFGAAGIPAFLYGPMGGDLHGTAEWASLRSLDQHVTLNRLLLEELSAGA